MSELLCNGGDSRLFLREGRLNRYNCPPQPVCPEQSVLRSSCTASPASQLGYAHALEKWDELAPHRGSASHEREFAEQMAAVRARLSSALQLPEGTAVVLSASGTDAEYVPLAIARELHAAVTPGGSTPTPVIVNSVLVADGEVGNGCREACAGEYFDTHGHAPFMEGRIASALLTPSNSRGRRLCGFDGIALHSICARRDADGGIVDAAAAIAEATASVAAEREAVGETDESWWVVRLVAGTKTAITTTVPDTLPPRSLLVVDACQMRLAPSAIRSYLDAGSVVLITGSKFMQGAAFSGAVLVPAALAQRLRDGSAAAPPLPAGLENFFSRHEVPAELSHWRKQLHGVMNEGLLARWHTALPHFERVCNMPEERFSHLARRWTDGVLRQLHAYHPQLVVESTEKGIVCVKCARSAGGRRGGFLDHEDLTRVHRWLSLDMIGSPGAEECSAAGKLVFLGQPVAITHQAAVLRIALGAEVLAELDSGQYDPSSDAACIEKLAWAVSRFATLSDWGEHDSEVKAHLQVPRPGALSFA